VLVDGAEVAYDHRHKAAYNALTYLLCEAGVRSPSAPNGPLSDEELFAVWRGSVQISWFHANAKDLSQSSAVVGSTWLKQFENELAFAVRALSPLPTPLPSVAPWRKGD